MKQIKDKLVALEREIATEKGALSLCVLVLREEAAEQWDLVVAAPWLDQDQKAGLAYVANKVSGRLTTQELLSLSRIVILEQGNPVLEALLQQGTEELRDMTVVGVPIKHAYRITSALTVTQEDQTLSASGVVGETQTPI